MSSAVTHNLAGKTLSDTYQVEEVIGEGGMGAVYRARHLRVPREFAIKVLIGEALQDDELFQRFRREAEIASSIGHENITQVFDFNYTDDGLPYMVLEYLDGEDLMQRLKREGPMSLDDVLIFLEQVTSGLEAAHARGIVHRDLKPANIFLCKRSRGRFRAKILDFGISKLSDNSMATRTGVIMGTPNYMSPEQAEGRISEIDQRTDVFALACIAFQCLTGQLAFEGSTMVNTLFQIVHGQPKDLLQLAPTLPTPLKDVFERAFAKLPADRTASVTQFYNEFENALSECDEDEVLAATRVGNYPGQQVAASFATPADQATPAPYSGRAPTGGHTPNPHGIAPTAISRPENTPVPHGTPIPQATYDHQSGAVPQSAFVDHQSGAVPQSAFVDHQSGAVPQSTPYSQGAYQQPMNARAQTAASGGMKKWVLLVPIVGALVGVAFLALGGSGSKEEKKTEPAAGSVEPSEDPKQEVAPDQDKVDLAGEDQTGDNKSGDEQVGGDVPDGTDLAGNTTDDKNTDNTADDKNTDNTADDKNADNTATTTSKSGKSGRGGKSGKSGKGGKKPKDDDWDPLSGR